jgi:hypothetical protein
MPESGPVRVAISVTLLAGVIALVFFTSDANTIDAVFSRQLSFSVALVLVLLAGGIILASLRLQLITSDLGYRLSFRDAAMALSVGQLAGSVFFQFAGQLIGRGTVLSRKGIDPAATVVISGYERVVALSVSLLFAAVGGIYLFGTLSINLESGGLSLIKLVLGLSVTIAAGALLAWGSSLRRVLRELTPQMMLRLLRSFAISFAIQATTLAAYVALGAALAPHVGVASLAAACCLVMLAASLPISFGGWGLRELSAVVALQAIGISTSSALLTALMIGFLSLAVIAGTAIFVLLGPAARPAPHANVQVPATPDYTAVLDQLLPILAATAVFFQIYLPTGAGRISVNLADPVVVVAAALFGLRYYGKNWPRWPVPQTSLFLAATTAVIGAALLRGWFSFGWSDWAFINKGLGWLVVLCYVATGALLILRAQTTGFDLLLRTFAATGAAIAGIEVVLGTLQSWGIAALDAPPDGRATGFAQNPNAFAFSLMLVLAVAMVLQGRAALRIGLMTATLLGIWFSGSRAGLVVIPALVVTSVFLRIALRPLIVAFALAVAIVVVLPLLPALVGQESPGGGVIALLSRNDPQVTYQHLETILQGLTMFLQHPIFGAGLGAYMHEQIQATGIPLVIHSTPVWLLAETGLVGFAVFTAAAWRLVSTALGRRPEPAALLLLLMLCALGTMSLVHELLYQRAFWLLLGAVLAMPVGAMWRSYDGRLPQDHARSI